MITNQVLEQEIIINLVLHETNRDKAITEIKAEYFTDIDCREMFEAIMACVKVGKDFSVHSLSNNQKTIIREFNKNRVGNNISSKEISLLRETAIRRNFESVSLQVTRKIQESTLEEAKKEISNFFSLEDGSSSELLTVNEQNDRYLRLIASRKNPANGLSGYEYPFKNIQKATLGAQKGEMVVVAARPSVGKSAFLENIAFHMSTNGFKVLFCSAEMSADSIIDRQVAKILKISSTDLRRGDIDFGLLTEALDKRKDFNLWDKGSMTTLDIRNQIKKLQMTTGIDAVFVDYLQKLRGEGKGEYERVTALSGELKAIAVDMNIPLITGVQYNRQAAKAQPQLSDLRDSGAIEQDADVVISLWNDEQNAKSIENRIETNVDILKNRNGAIFQSGYKLHFIKNQTVFYDIFD